MSLRHALSVSVIAAASVLALAACPTDSLVDPLRISEVHFEQTIVSPGQTIEISAAITGEFDGSPTIEWSVDAGTLSVVDALTTTWTAPETNQLVAIQLLVSVGQPGLEEGEVSTRAFITDLIVGTGIDHDGDGYSIAEGDCDDTNGAIYPGAPDLADGLNNDCDDETDEGSPDFDDDGDGFSDIEGDCDDSDVLINPQAEERINDIDDNCNGTIDEGTDAYDDDGDGSTENGGDCNDLSSAVHPNAVEILDGIDNNCDGTTDEGTAAYDDDQDGYTELQGDCDDDPLGAGQAASPVGIEIADGIDNDCNGIIDDGDFATDDDLDGWSELAGDCDDTDAYTYPGAPEFQDGEDNDCNGTVDDGIDNFDDDNDGYTEADGDCDDYNSAVYPGAPEIQDVPVDYDNDCDGFVFENPPFAISTASAGPYDTCNLVLLDGSQSWDPDGDSFIYYWYFAWQPINSNLDTPNINNGSTANADFQPDVAGLWIVGLLTNDSMFNSTPSFLEFPVLDGGVCP